MIDLEPAARRTADFAISVGDDQLERPTPCPDLTVGALIDHLGIFAVRFEAAARKDVHDRSRPPDPDAANLEPGWRDRLARDMHALAEAWRDPEAWQGTTVAGGRDMPGEVVGLVALDELVVHGWDLAVATGQAYEPTLEEIDGATGFVTSFELPRDGSLFGPIVPVDAAASPLDKLLGLTGRDPAWHPPA